jgi:hyaluronan synthase
VYQTFFPVLLGIGISFQITLAIQQRSLLPIFSLFLTMFLGGFVKGLIAGIVSRDAWKLLQSIYGFVFLFILIPARIDALLRLWDTRWGTKSRAQT